MSADPARAEIQRSLFFRVPACILVWRLGKRRNPIPGEPRRLFRVGRRGAAVFALAFPALLIIGLAVSFAARFSGLFPGAPVPSPLGPPAWCAAVLASLCAGFLEESYFRAYLLPCLQDAGMRAKEAAAVSAILFALCHVYEGPWGFVNAALAGLALSFFYIRYNNLCGIALAHGLYNVTVYLAAAIGEG